MKAVLLAALAVSAFGQTGGGEAGGSGDNGRGICQDRGITPANAARAYSLAGAYRGMANAYADQGYVPGALQNYDCALIVLNQLATSNPSDPRVRGELFAVVRRVRALGGTIPVWVRLPLPGAQAEEPSPEPAPEQPAPPSREQSPDFETPQLDTSTLSKADQKICDDAIERYSRASASAQAATGILDGVRESLHSQGLSLRADYITAESRIRSGLDNARRDIDHRHCQHSFETLTIVSERSRRLLSEFGQ